MLVLTRKPGGKVVIGGGITVSVVRVTGKQVRIGIEAPAQVRILRAALACRQEEATADHQPQRNLEARPGQSVDADTTAKPGRR